MAGDAIFGDRPRALQRARRRQGHAQHRAERREIIVRGPFDQPPQRRGERRRVIGVEQRPQPIVADLRRPRSAPAPRPRRRAGAARAARRRSSPARPPCPPARDSRAGPSAALSRMTRARIHARRSKSRGRKGNRARDMLCGRMDAQRQLDRLHRPVHAGGRGADPRACSPAMTRAAPRRDDASGLRQLQRARDRLRAERQGRQGDPARSPSIRAWSGLFFLQGRWLDDPHGLLEGAGKQGPLACPMSDAGAAGRSAHRRADRRSALDKAELPIDPAQPQQLIIKAISAKQRPRRPA